MTAAGVQRSCAAARRQEAGYWLLRALGLAATLGLAQIGGAAAFPLVMDPMDDGPVPPGTELAAPDVQDLRNQLQIVNGLGAPLGGGWTFVPRFDFQEMLTDNVLEQHTPRQWDAVSYFAPGFTLAGITPAVTLNLSYSPTLTLYAHDGSLNAFTQQLTGLATVTVIDNLAFVDFRALSGVQNAFGGLGGVGAVGAGTGATTQTGVPTLAGNAQGLTKNNEVKTASFGVSPYLLRQIGDVGTIRVGESLNITRSDTLSGFAAPPVPGGGINGQTLVSNEQNAHFVTGDVLQMFQNAIDADLQQTSTTAEAGAIDVFNGQAVTVPNHSSSTRQVFSDTLTYQITRGFSVFGSGGHEDIVYSGAGAGVGAPSVHDLTWSLGVTWLPNPDSRLTVSYGHQNGFNSFSADGFYAFTARTSVTLSYGSTLGTQLENLQNQLNQAATGTNGTLVNGQTGGQLFGSTNALPVAEGVFRTDTLTTGTTTTLNRDIITTNLTLTKQSSSGAAAGASAEAKTFGLTWVHQMRPDMTLNSAVFYSLQDQNAETGIKASTSTSLVASLAWQWQLSDTVSTSLRYSFLERQSAIAANSLYQNMLILGFSKTF